MNKTYQSEVGTLGSVLMKHPREAYKNEDSIKSQWKQLNYLSKPDFSGACEEYEAFVEIFTRHGIDIHFLTHDNDMGLDSIYVRDTSISTNRGMIVCNMGKPERNREPAAQLALFQTIGEKILGIVESPGTVEGGDVAWINEHMLAIGRGYRTNDQGIRQVTNMISEFAEIFQVDLPHYKGPSDVFHLMSVFSPVDKNLAVVYSPLIPVRFRDFLLMNGFELVEVPDNEFETLGCNVLALAPGKCLMIEGNPVTKERLVSAGVNVIEYKGEEISIKGCGGPTCLTRPIQRGY